MKQKNYESPLFMEWEFIPEGTLCQSTVPEALKDWEIVEETW